VTARPLVLTPVPQADIDRGDGEYICEFIETFCRITKESVGGHAGELIRLRPWQRELIGQIYARRPDGRYRHREVLIGLPRKNGKSALGSSFGLAGLVMGGEGAEVYSCAADKDQARIVFGVAKDMRGKDADLTDLITPYRDSLQYTSTGSSYKVISSEAFTKEGLNPTTVVYDELHAAPDDELYDVMSLAFGARKDPLLIIITTAGVIYDTTGQESICYRRFEYGKKVASGEIDDPTFFMCWYGAPDGAKYRDPQVWADANPGYGDLIDPEDFVSVLGKVTENAFRTKRLNQWVSSQQAWLPQGAWETCRDPDREFVPGRRGVVLGFDGSKSGDTTGLLAVTVDQDPVVRVIGHWERPEGAAPDWKVPRGQVKDKVREYCREMRDQGIPVREIAWDEWLWLDAAEELEDDGLPVVVFPQTLQRMGPATQRAFEMITHRKVAHDGHPGLARHLANAILRTDSRGSRLVKDSKNSPRKIDLAVAFVMALDRAGFWLTEPIEGDYVWKDGAGNVHSTPVEELGIVW
jgi:phage terminase large subunit-like protein